MIYFTHSLMEGCIMKRVLTYIVLILMLVPVVQAQDYESKLQTIQAYPRTVVKEARVALDEALKSSKSQDLIDALMQLSAAQLMIDSDSIIPVVEEIESIMNRCRNTVDRSVIALYLCDVYNAYLSHHFFRYAHRSYVEGNSDVMTWSAQNFYDKIDSLQQVALKPAGALQKTPISRYRSIIGVEGYEGADAYEWVERFYPTMYDFVASAIYSMGIINNHREYNGIVPQGCHYTSSRKFMSESVLVADTAWNAPLWRMLGSVMKYHYKHKQRAALFMWDLKRLQYTHLLSGNDTEYVVALDNLISQYAGSDYVVEAVIARYAQTLPDTPQQTKEVYDVLSRWVRRYPHYYRIGCLQSMCADLSSASVSLSMPYVVYPGDSIVADVSYNNIDSIEYILWKSDVAQPIRELPSHNTHNCKWEKCFSHTVVCEGVDFKPYERRQMFAPLSAGVYRMTVASGGKKDEVTFVVTPYLLLTVKSTPRETHTLLVDNKSGKPIGGKSIILASRTGEIIQQLPTDDKGVCRFVRPSVSGSYYNIYLADVAQYPFMHSLYFTQAAVERKNVAARIFTDRSLYRPGQTLHFSALVYRLDSSMQQALVNKDVKAILYDKGGDEVWNGSFTTDKYGSINGVIELPAGAAWGDWKLCVQGDNLYASQKIEVAEYKRPQFAVACDAVEGVYSYGDSVRVSGRAMTYSGVAVAFASATYVVRQYTYLYGGGEIVAQGATSTSADGDFSFTFVAQEPQEEYARVWGTRYVAEITVTSATGESRQGEMVVSVQGVGVKFNCNIPNKVCRDAALPYSIGVVNGSGVVQQLPYSLSLYSTVCDEVGGECYVRSRDAIWQSEGVGSNDRLMLPYKSMASGTYRLFMSTRTTGGELITDSVDFVCYSHSDVRPPVATEMWLPIDRYEAEDGDTVCIAVGSALQNASLYYFISDGERRIEYDCLHLDNSMTTIRLPYNAACDDVVQVMFVLVHNKSVHRKMVTMHRKQPDKHLTITPTTFRDKTRPGSRETWHFTVRNADGKPVDALFMAEMYDASLDALTTHSWFFNPRYTPYARYTLWIDYLWYLTSTNRAYVNYRNEFINAQYINSVSPMLKNYLMLSYGVGGGVIMQRMMTQSASNRTMSKGSMTADMMIDTEVEESVADYAETDGALEEVAPIPDTPLSKIEYRDNMEETAFFYPHLVTNDEGNVVVEFTVPESNTTWNFLSMAVTPQLYNGMYTASVVSSKPLMIQPNMPRFVRQGDKTTLSAAIYNTTDEVLRGEAQLTLYHPDNEQVIFSSIVPFTTDAGASATVQFSVSIPDTLSLVGVRIGASTAICSDGEQHLLAVLPSQELVTEAKPFYVAPSVGDTTITFDSMREKIKQNEVRNVRVTLEYCDNPVWYAVTALPALAQPIDRSAVSLMASLYANVVATGIVSQNDTIARVIAEWNRQTDGMALVSQLAQNEELKQLLLSETPWLLEADNATEQLQQIAGLLDKERANKLAQEAVDLLRTWQDSNGGWAWFNGMQPSFAVTLNITAGLSRLARWGGVGSCETVATMQMDALRYLDAEYVCRNKQQAAVIDYNDLCYLYVRSAFRDVPMSAEVLDIHRQQLDTIAAQWYKLDEIEKAYAAVALYRYGYVAIANDIVNSLREYAVNMPSQGMFWPNNRSTAFYRNSAIQIHCAIYEAFELVSPRMAELDAMRQWLLLQKQTQMWGNVPSTLDAVNILLLSGSQWMSVENRTQIEWGSLPMPAATQAEEIMGYAKYVRTDSEIVPADATVKIENHYEKPSWGAIYWQYYDSIADVEAYRTEEIAIERRYYVERNGELVAVEKTTLGVGDEVVVQLTLRTQRDMQFMTLVDSRPACFEPQEQLPQYRYSQGLWHYTVPGDAATTLYFDYLPRGVYVVEYKVYVDRVGEYQAGVATLQGYYAPQQVAHTQGTWIQVSLP